MLKDEHAVKGLAWAKKYKDWTQEDLEGVIFSDESMIEKSKILRVFGCSEHLREIGIKTAFMGLQKDPG